MMTFHTMTLAHNGPLTDDAEPHGTDPNEDEPVLPDNDPVPDDPELTEIADEEEEPA